jgi:GNAT superfamily N-acetyltransferase
MAESEIDFAAARQLFREYQQSLRADVCFPSFEAELANLPAGYLVILIAWDPTGAAGCVALRRQDADSLEMKRLFVRPAHRGQGLGRRLVEAAIGAARGGGQRHLRLDTLPGMAEAIALYRSMGFEPIRRYNTNPDPGALFFQLDL